MQGCKECEGFLPGGNNSPIAAPFAGECQVATSQVQLICLPPTLGASLLMWKYDDDATLNDFAIPSGWPFDQNPDHSMPIWRCALPTPWWPDQLWLSSHHRHQHRNHHRHQYHCHCHHHHQHHPYHQVCIANPPDDLTNSGCPVYPPGCDCDESAEEETCPGGFFNTTIWSRNFGSTFFSSYLSEKIWGVCGAEIIVTIRIIHHLFNISHIWL